MGLEIFFTAFFDLSRSRGAFGGPIPWIEVDRYGERLGFDEETLEELHYYIERMDEAWLQYQETRKDKK